jgi:hypothetical protein
MINNRHGKLGASVFEEEEVAARAIVLTGNTTKPKKENRRDVLLPFRNRTYDVVMFGTMTGRCATLKDEFVKYRKQRLNGTAPPWNIMFEANHENLPNYYKNAKICLIVHSYLDVSAMEYRRMSDFSRMGCIPPVIEEVGEKLFVDALGRCANVRFFKSSGGGG